MSNFVCDRNGSISLAIVSFDGVTHTAACPPIPLHPNTGVSLLALSLFVNGNTSYKTYIQGS